jgi:ribosomal protein L7Ae-like RNA K-turn-binding protein
MSRIEEYKINLDKLCEEYGVPVELVVEMLEIETAKLIGERARMKFLCILHLRSKASVTW